MEKPAHPSDSRVQLEIEKKVVVILSERDKIEYNNGEISIELDIETKVVKIIHNKGNVINFKNGKPTKETVKFNFDFHFFSDDLNIIGEIYAGINKISPGQRKKIITDCFKMVFAEELLGYKCDKRLIFIDEKIEKAFKGDSWAAKAIEKFNIKTNTENFRRRYEKNNKYKKITTNQQP